MPALITREEIDEKFKAVWIEIRRLGNILEGPPHPGLEKSVNDFLVMFQTLETERSKQHKQNRDRLNLILLALTGLAGYLVFFRH